MRTARIFSAASRRAEDSDFGVEGGTGKKRRFVERFVAQDKGSAVRHGIFAAFRNELAAFSPQKQP